jgi:hypothetical protein
VLPLLPVAGLAPGDVDTLARVLSGPGAP